MTPDQLRSHLDEVLAGTGDGLPSTAAPSLLRTARRRTRTHRIVAAVGGLAVVAVAAVGVSGAVTGSASEPALLQPAGPTAAATVPATTSPTVPAGQPTAASAEPATPVNAPTITGQGDLTPVQTVSLSSPATAPGVGYRVAGTRVLRYTAPGTLLVTDTRTGAVDGTITGLPKTTLTHVTADDTTGYVAEADNGKPAVVAYDLGTGARLRGYDLPASTNRDCNPTTSCLSDQVLGTDLAVVAGRLLVVTPGSGGSTNVVTFDPATGAAAQPLGFPGQNFQVVAVRGSTAYLYAPGLLTAVTLDGSGLHLTFGANVPSPNADIVVGPAGLYESFGDNTGGPNPDRPTTFTLKRLDLKTLQPQATVTETVPGDSPAALSIATAGSALYSTLSTCPSGHAQDACVQERDPVTLAVRGAAVLRVHQDKGDYTDLQDSVDGLPYLYVDRTSVRPESVTLTLLDRTAKG